MLSSTSPVGRKRVRMASIIGAASVLAVSGIGYAAASEVADHVKRTEVFSSLHDRPQPSGGINILLVGSDNRAGLSGQDRKRFHTGAGDFGNRTDSIMIAHLATDGSVGVVSIPRDSIAQIPAYTDATGHTTQASNQKINAAFSIGGPALTVATVEKATGVYLDHYAEIDFSGFVDMVDGLGGVPVCSKIAIDDKSSGLKLQPGVTNLAGAQALGYVRARHFDPSADLGRIQRQQKFVASMFKKATSAGVVTNPAKLLGFFNAAADSVTIDEQFDRATMWALAAQMRSINPSTVTFQTVPLGGNRLEPGIGDVVVWDQVKAAALFSALNSSGPLNAAPKASKTQAATVEVSPGTVAVQMYNASNTSGLGTKAGADLRAAGFSVASQAFSAPRSDVTVIKYDPRYDVSLKTIQAALPGAQVEAVRSLGHTFKIYVGNDYSGLRQFSLAQGAGGNSDHPATAADNPCD